MRMRTLLLRVAVLLTPLSLTVPAPAGVVPITGTAPDGRTYSQLAEDWWQWAMSIPKPRSPLIDHVGDFAYEGQSGDVFFLAPAVDTDSSRDIFVEPDKYLFFPLVSGIFFNGEDENFTESEMRGFLDDFIGSTSIFYATLDGEQVLSPWLYRAATPAGGFQINLPVDDIYDLDQSGPTGPAVADGFWLLVEPLELGDHIVRFEGGTEDPLEYTYFSSVVYRITVPEPAGCALVLTAIPPILLRRRCRRLI